MTTTMGSLDLSALNNLYDETQYFWFESSAQPWGAGAHITLYPQSEFTTSTHANYLKGQNILMNTDGLSIRNGTLPMMILNNNSLNFNVVDATAGTYVTTATFSTDGAVIGQNTSGQTRTEITSSGMQVVRKDDSTDITIANLGYGSGINESGGTSIAPYYTLGERLSGSTIGNYSVVEGKNATSSNFASHAEGVATTSSGDSSHAEGYSTTASGNFAHAEGASTTASGSSSHAEGSNTTASGVTSHSEGYDATASGTYSHAQNQRTIAAKKAQTVLGSFNKEDTSTTTTHPSEDTDYGEYAFIIGNGASNNARSNAFTVDWSGNVTAAGVITAAGLPSGLTTKLHSVSTGSVSATSDSGSKTATVTKSGYYPLAVSGWYFAGTNLMYQTLYSCRLSSRSNGSATITYRFYNRSSAAYNGTFYFEILWAKI